MRAVQDNTVTTASRVRIENGRVKTLRKERTR